MSLMKKIGLLIIVMLFLAACGSSSAEDDVVKDSGEAAKTSETIWEELSADFADNALHPATQLVVGTFMLEDSDLVVDPDLAANLVPYWKLYKTLLESDTTAQEEVDGLILEIQEVMTPDQVNYIAGLELTQEDMKTLINELGILEDIKTKGFGDENESGFTKSDSMPEGVGPGGGQGGRGGTEGMDPEAVATMQAKREEQGGGDFFGGNRMIMPLIEELITLLEGKTES